ncbi:MAG: calycin-like domain-containing protein [Prevotella sp.]|nr:calycin-like domain-containing protein [Prevotella sp.]
MKKVFTLLVSALMATASFATDYTDNLTVTVDGKAMPAIQSTISVTENADGTYKFALNNFKFMTIPLGNIVMDNIAGTTNNGVTTLKAAQDVKLSLGTMPISLMAEKTGSSLHALIDIYYATLGQTIHVVFGNNSNMGYQLKNSGFEDWHIATKDGGWASASGDEPNNWHDMLSCSSEDSTIGYLAAYNPFVFKTDTVRPGSIGKHAALLRSFEIFGIVANGTVTTGRLNAGSTDAADKSNHAYLDMSKTDKDSNGDPFYQTVSGTPDSVAVWMAFKQGTPNATYPHATLSAALTDGTYYQDPDSVTYTNVRALAKDTTITTTFTTGLPVWKRVVVPFNMIDANVEGKALLLTMATNANPGKGSTDSLYVDDLSLIYNTPIVEDIAYKGTTISGFKAATTRYTIKDAGVVSLDDITVKTSGANGARVYTEMRQSGADAVVTVSVYSGDLSASQVYTLTFTGATTGVRAVEVNDAKTAAQPVEIYAINGQRVSAMQPGQVYIVKQGNKTVKVIK